MPDHTALLLLLPALLAATSLPAGCKVDQLDLTAEVCLPTVRPACSMVKVKGAVLETREDCLQVARTVCTLVSLVMAPL